MKPKAKKKWSEVEEAAARNIVKETDIRQRCEDGYHQWYSAVPYWYCSKCDSKLRQEPKPQKAILQSYQKGRNAMCEHKERDEIGGDCEVCAEIVKEAGLAYKRGYQKGLEEGRNRK